MKVSGAAVGISVIAFIYNFSAMYYLVGKCPDDISTKSCRAYNNWTMTNKIGLVILGIGLVILAYGFMKQYQKKVSLR